MTDTMPPVADEEQSPRVRRPIETTSIIDAARIGCASCDWHTPDGHPDAHRLAKRHAERNPGHLATVDSSRSRTYIIRDA